MGMLFDALIIFGALAVAAYLEWHMTLNEALLHRRDAALSGVATGKLIAAFLGFAVVLLWTSSHHNESRLKRRSLVQEQKLNLQDCAIAGLVLVSVLYLIGAEALPRGFVLLLVLLVALGLGLRRLIYRTFPEEPAGPCNVLIIGADSTACALREQLRDGAGLGYAFKGFVKLSHAELDSKVDPGEVVGTVDKLAEHVCRYAVKGVFLTASCGREMTRKIARQARELGIDARMVPGHLRFAVDPKKSWRF